MMSSAIQQDNAWNLKNQDGRGTLGTILTLVLMGLAIIAGIKLFPVYYAHKGFETDVRTEVARAGAQFLDDPTVMKNILALARRNEIRLGRDNVKLERFAGQLHVTVTYTVPVDFLVLKQDMKFEVKASTFIGKL